ncbi:MAG TPA: dolichyl-phosphate beta-glucosyltransferase [Candidatus Paceibacterota bacterium]|nr:dolichyl-phosphate beta-glucosyltransferase [Candidatus Paceibacterota bacterium]
MKKYLSIIIPAYNEAKRLPTTLVDVDRYLKGADFSAEVIVVDSSSSDGTQETVLRFSRTMKNLKLLRIENRGKGYAVRRGMLEAEGEWRLFMDADNATAAGQFEKMRPYLKGGYDVIIGSRDIPGARLVPPQPWYRRVLGNIGNLIIQVLLLPGIWDTQCGFKCFSGRAAEKIFKLSRIEKWGFDVEILALAKKLGYKIKEIPVTWVNDPNSKVKASAYFTTLAEVFKIRRWLWTNEYGL